MPTCYVCFSEIEAAGDAVGTTFVSASHHGSPIKYRRRYAHAKCHEQVAQAEIAAMKSDPDFRGFGLDGFPIDE